MHGLNAGDQLFCTPERLEPKHKIGDLFHCPVVLLNDVVEIFGLA
jgi:hypothetical protein